MVIFNSYVSLPEGIVNMSSLGWAHPGSFAWKYGFVQASFSDFQKHIGSFWSVDLDSRMASDGFS